MPDAGARFLLLLGSSRSDDALLARAVERLAAHGSARLVTAVHRYPADDGGTLQYYNALAVWQTPGAGAERPRRLIGRIEAALGRDRSRRDEVAIDIDLLAVCRDWVWRAHPHALVKREFDRALVRSLLDEAAIDVVDAPARVTTGAPRADSDVQ